MSTEKQSLLAEKLRELSEVDIRTVDTKELVDIENVRIREDLPIPERIQDYVKQIKNPYCFKCGKFTVRAQFARNGVSLEECLKQILL